MKSRPECPKRKLRCNRYNINIHTKKKAQAIKKIKMQDEDMAEQKLDVRHNFTELEVFS